MIREDYQGNVHRVVWGYPDLIQQNKTNSSLADGRQIRESERKT
jgi:hypothetical protein